MRPLAEGARILGAVALGAVALGAAVTAPVGIVFLRLVV